EDRANAGDELPELEGLREKVVGAQVERTGDVRAIPVGGEHQDGGLGFLTDLSKHLKPIDTWEPDIQDDDVRTVGLPPAQRRGAIGGLGDHEALATQNVCGEVEHVRLVLYEKNLDHGIASTAMYVAGQWGCCPLNVLEQTHYERRSARFKPVTPWACSPVGC